MEKKPEISVIICSVNPERYEKTVSNIRETIGLEAEFIRIDNKKEQWPISKAYNEGARRASSDCFLFIHEDVLFENRGWGVDMVAKLHEKRCGVIGFIGTPYRLGALAGWNEYGDDCYGHLMYIAKGRRLYWHNEPWPEGQTKPNLFVPVLVVDGLSMAVPRSVWEEVPFDETTIRGFHAYDIDYCLDVAAKGYQSYVYMKADVCHYSNGNMDDRWVKITLEMTEGKWKDRVPMAVGGKLPENWEEIMARADYDFAFKALRGQASKETAKEVLRHYREKCRTSAAHRRHLFVLNWQYMLTHLLGHRHCKTPSHKKC